MKYRYHFTKPYIFELIRGVVLCYLLKILLKNNEHLEYIRQNLYTLYSIDAQGNRFFSFVKCILVFSIFILGFYRSLIFLSELSEDYYKCVKYRSKHRYHYLWNRTKLQFHFFLPDMFVWIAGFCYINFYTPIQLIQVMVLLLLNFFLLWLINFLSPNALMTYLLFVVVIFVQLSFGLNLWGYVIFASVGLVIIITRSDHFVRRDES